MKYYQLQHQFYCNVDLHARTMHVCTGNPSPRVPEGGSQSEPGEGRLNRHAFRNRSALHLGIVNQAGETPVHWNILAGCKAHVLWQFSTPFGVPQSVPPAASTIPATPTDNTLKVRPRSFH